MSSSSRKGGFAVGGGRSSLGSGGKAGSGTIYAAFGRTGGGALREKNRKKSGRKYQHKERSRQKLNGGPAN